MKIAVYDAIVIPLLPFPRHVSRERNSLILSLYFFSMTYINEVRRFIVNFPAEGQP
jgi:hypothetical protein